MQWNCLAIHWSALDLISCKRTDITNSCFHSVCDSDFYTVFGIILCRLEPRMAAAACSGLCWPQIQMPGSSTTISTPLITLKQRVGGSWVQERNNLCNSQTHNPNLSPALTFFEEHDDLGIKVCGHTLEFSLSELHNALVPRTTGGVATQCFQEKSLFSWGLETQSYTDRKIGSSRCQFVLNLKRELYAVPCYCEHYLDAKLQIFKYLNLYHVINHKGNWLGTDFR